MEYRSELKQFGLTYFHLFTFSTLVYILGTLHTSTQVLNLGPFSFHSGTQPGSFLFSTRVYILGTIYYNLFVYFLIHFTLLYFALILVYSSLTLVSPLYTWSFLRPLTPMLIQPPYMDFVDCLPQVLETHGSESHESGKPLPMLHL